MSGDMRQPIAVISHFSVQLLAKRQTYLQMNNHFNTQHTNQTIDIEYSISFGKYNK